MTERQRVRQRIEESGIVAVLRGVDADRIVPVAHAIHDAGAAAVGVGSSIVDYDAIEADDTEQVRRTAATVVDAVENARQ
ncbi:hypothetical protein [Natronorubrum sp. FCH18a]|uniref:hypothetical protein n=1 Tax=Natronorubrum sp. FCH18a TaxID=3447018 RepID=UPI003F516D73